MVYLLNLDVSFSYEWLKNADDTEIACLNIIKRRCEILKQPMPSTKMIEEHPNLNKLRNEIIKEKKKMGWYKKRSPFDEFGKGKRKDKK